MSWHPPAGAILYDAHPTTRTGPHTVSVDVHRVGTVDRGGNYRVDPGTLPARFTVVRESGQWRISHLPAQVLLSTADAERTLLSVTLYYFNRSQSTLVPEPILVPPDAAGLATTLIRGLIDGPAATLGPSVVNALPHGTDLVGNVTVGTDDGVAEVDLGGAVEQASGAQLQRLSAQIVWTLAPGVVGHRRAAAAQRRTASGVRRCARSSRSARGRSSTRRSRRAPAARCCPTAAGSMACPLRCPRQCGAPASRRPHSAPMGRSRPRCASAGARPACSSVHRPADANAVDRRERVATRLRPRR